MNLISSSSGSIEYRAYLRNSGWTDWASNGSTQGSSGAIIEALEARLVGLPQYSVQLQPQVEGEWWGYVYDGQTAGSIGSRLTAYRVEIVQKVYVAPTPSPIVTEEPEVILGGGSTINTSPLILDVDNDGFDDPFGYGTVGSYWSNYQLGSSSVAYRVKGLTVVNYSGAGAQIPVIDTFGSYGDDAVNSNQFEVYLGIYENDIFTITSAGFNSFSYSTTSTDANYATHTMILFDNEDITVEGYTDVYPSGDPEHLNGIVMAGVYEERNSNLQGRWTIDSSTSQHYLVWVAYVAPN